jgi:hypothetical protein
MPAGALPGLALPPPRPALSAGSGIPPQMRLQFPHSDYADLKTEGDTAGQSLAWVSVDAGGAGDLGLLVFLGAGGRSGSESLESLVP